MYPCPKSSGFPFHHAPQSPCILKGILALVHACWLLSVWPSELVGVWSLPCLMQMVPKGARAHRSEPSPIPHVLLLLVFVPILWSHVWETSSPPHLPLQFLSQSRHCKSLGYQRNSSLEGLKLVTISCSQQRSVYGSPRSRCSIAECSAFCMSCLRHRKWRLCECKKNLEGCIPINVL